MTATLEHQLNKFCRYGSISFDAFVKIDAWARLSTQRVASPIDPPSISP